MRQQGPLKDRRDIRIPTDKGTVLDSWKEIAAYLGRGNKTCRQWERDLGLPVHRLDDSPKARVFAYTEELDAWRIGREQKADEKGRRAQRLTTGVAALMVLAVLGLVAFGKLRTGRNSRFAAQPVKRLVVLPFENMGATEDEYFADGLTEEITARINGIRQIEVIGRSTAAQYKKTVKTPQQIGRELDVDYILSGTVRCQRTAEGTGRVRITPSLGLAADGTQLWAGTYDEDLARVFQVQTNIAVRVSKALKIALGGSERRGLRVRPTRDQAAHDYFLLGWKRYYPGRQNRESLLDAIGMFEKAVKADPAYLDAYARLASSQALMFWWFDHTEERADRARVAAEMALELGPESPEAHAAMGMYFYLCRLDYDRALEHLQKSLETRPRSSETLSYVAYVKRRQGRLDEALAQLQAAFRIDPRDGEICANLGDTYQLLRNYAEAERYYRQAASIMSDMPSPWISPNGSLANLSLYGLGDVAKLKSVLDEASPRAKSPDDATWLHYFRALAGILEGRYEEALGHASQMPLAALDSEFEFVLKEQLQAQIFGLLGDKKRERDRYEAARIILSHQIGERPEDPRLHGALGIVCAGLGLRDEAIREASRAAELLPVSREFWRGIFHVRDLARVFARAGELGLALERLEYLLSLSGYFSAAWLEADPVWAPLRSMPRFAALLGRAE